MKSGVATESHRLTFHWPRRPRISLTLVGLFFLSLLAHALAFYIFQVSYPLVVTVSTPPAQVSLLAPTSPENQALLKWIDSEDPAAIANPHEIIPTNLNDVPYRPSFAEVRTAPKPFEEMEADVRFPSAKKPLAMIDGSLQPAKKTIPANPPVQKTQIKFFGALAKRKIMTEQPLKLEASSNTSLEPLSFFVGVDARGTVLYTFFMGTGSDSKVQNSSGDASIDRQAETHLRGIEFGRDPRPITWGVATFYWGSDAFNPNHSPQKP